MSATKAKSQSEVDVFKDFFREFYSTEIGELKDEIGNTLTIDFTELNEFDEDLSNLVKMSPEDTIYNARCALSDMLNLDKPSLCQILIDNYDGIELSIDELRDKHIGRLVSIDAVVSKTTEISPKVNVASFECRNGHTTRIEQPFHSKLTYPMECSSADCNVSSERDFRINVQSSEKINFQELKVKQPQDELTGGKTPEMQKFNVRGDIAGLADAGDRINITGVYRASENNNSSILKTYIRGYNIDKNEEELEDIEISTEDEERITELSNRSNIYGILRDSIAPGLYGLKSEKRAIMYQLFGGVAKKENTRIRGNIHVLFVGDPGVGKSQLLRYASKISTRGIMTSGKGASEAGITAAAVKDSDFGGGDKWSLEAGALVLSDKGVACVDELDKMTPSDRDSMHEALEQQTISINKAGINATLKSRCALLGAANPKEGRWRGNLSITEQIDIEPALVSRFDLIFAPKDKQGKDRDSKLATHIISANKRGQQIQAGKSPDKDSEQIVPEIGPKLFKKYIAYSRNNIDPVTSEDAESYLRDFYVSMRDQSDDESGAVPITARKIEALIRLAEASARIRLSDKIEVKDAKRAVDIVKESLRDVGYDEQTGEYDADMIESEFSSSQRDIRDAIQYAFEDCEENGEADKSEVFERAAELSDSTVDDRKIKETYQRLKYKNDLPFYEPPGGKLSEK